MRERPTKELVQRCAARAAELGWLVEWCEEDDDRRLVVTDPDEPALVGTMSVVLGATQTWWSAARELHLIDDARPEDMHDMAALHAMEGTEEQALFRLDDDTKWIGRVTKLTNKLRRGKVVDVVLDLYVQRIYEGQGRMSDLQRVARSLDAVLEVVHMKASTCKGCGNEFYFAPTEEGDGCPECGELIVNEHFDGGPRKPDICTACNAFRPCKCDIERAAMEAAAAHKANETPDSCAACGKKIMAYEATKWLEYVTVNGTKKRKLLHATCSVFPAGSTVQFKGDEDHARVLGESG